ncbi:WW domain-binding protein 2 [Fasciola hepatica]|uniref:WW domain-binding protein 2 n=1 Tax=Fasciola hepatica TaxID=6192 RepID=A0A4E0RUU8_FASHE|nr:WW domain-binding protein 2 [Fasciola hepatica]
MARVSGVRAKHAGCPIRISVRTFNVASLKRRLGRRRASSGESGFGGTWILDEGGRGRTGTVLPSETLPQGEAEFKMTFKKGGAIEFAQALIDLGRRACSAKQTFRPPPPYNPTMDMNGAGQFYSCPPPAYAPPYNDPYYGFIKPHEAFSQPPPSSLYHVGAPPPYPGAAPQADNTWPSAPPYPQNPGYPAPPNQFDGFGAVGGNANSSDAPMSAAHAG